MFIEGNSFVESTGIYGRAVSGLVTQRTWHRIPPEPLNFFIGQNLSVLQRYHFGIGLNSKIPEKTLLVFSA